jgi:hypothetical protein
MEDSCHVGSRLQRLTDCDIRRTEGGKAGNGFQSASSDRADLTQLHQAGECEPYSLALNWWVWLSRLGIPEGSSEPALNFVRCGERQYELLTGNPASQLRLARLPVVTRVSDTKVLPIPSCNCVNLTVLLSSFQRGPFDWELQNQRQRRMIMKMPMELTSHDRFGNHLCNSEFGRYTDAEIGRARPYGRVRQAELGEILYRPGDDQELINLSSLKYFFAVGGTAALLSREML